MTTVSQSVRSRTLGLLIAAVSLPAPALLGQSAPAPTTNQNPGEPPSAVASSSPSSDEAENVVRLDPFQVQSSGDAGYGASNTTSLSRFNMELSKTPVFADVLNSQLISDTQSTTLEELFQYAGNGGQVLATPESDSTATQPGDRYSVSQLAIRGVSAGNARRDGFQFNDTNTNANTLFDIDRVDILHGSQGLLYGATGAGGVVNVVSKEATFGETFGTSTYRLDDYGGKLGNLDINEGASWVAFRGDVQDQDNRNRYLYTGDQLQAYYGQLAFALPLQTVFRIEGEETHDNRIYDNQTSVNFGGTNIDPRSGDNLSYLLATNQLGAINPYTGQPYPGGAIDNGYITGTNLKSFAGWTDEEDTDNDLYEAVLDTNWTSWVSTSFGAFFNKSQFLRGTNIGSLTAPGVAGVPTNLAGDWTIDSSLANSESPDRKKEYRASVLFTNDIWGGRIHSQTSIGYDREYDDSSGGIGYEYYAANPDGSVTLNPAASNLGRTQIPTVYWSVNNGPVLYALPKVGAQEINWNGTLYTRMPTNPRSPAWITPGNPLGDANQYEAYISSTGTNTNGVSGGNSGGFADQTKNEGWYIGNFSSWWSDRVDTFLGLRESSEFTRSPNTQVAAVPEPNYVESRSPTFPAYNIGADVRLLSWLRGYAEYSRTWDTVVGSNDAYGDIPKNPTGYTYEAGLKARSDRLHLNGELAGFFAYSENDNYNAGTNYENTVNPNGLNGRNPGVASPNQWAQYNKQSQGVELNLTAAPTRNWSFRFVADAQQATVESTSQYNMLYNDQFRVNSAGNVVYGNGQLVMVPTDSAGLALVAKQTSAINMANPATTAYANSTLVPLTLSMINTPSSPYYAFGLNTLPQNEPINGSIGNPVSGSEGTNYLKNVLANFQNNGTNALTGVTGLPFSDIQYNFADPAGYDGVYIVQKKGDRAVGTPAISMGLTTKYSFDTGWLNGFFMGASWSQAWYMQSFYFQTPDHLRHLFGAPAAENSSVNSFFGYVRKLRRITWSTQLNIKGMFNHYDLAINPNNGTGYNTPANVSASLYGTPRVYVWTNSIAF